MYVIISVYFEMQIDLLRGDTIEVTSIINPPFLQLKSNADSLSGLEKYEGFNVDLLYKLQDILGAKFNINLVKDGKYGNCDSKEGEDCHNWNGMIGEVYNGNADMALADITVAPKRVMAVDFTQAFLNGGLVVLAQSSAPDSINQLITEGYEFLVVPGGSTQKLFETSDDDLLKRMLPQLRFYGPSLADSYKLMKSGEKTVVVAETSYAKFYAGKDCSVKILDERLNSVSYGIAIAKGAAKRVGGSVYDIRTLLDYAITSLKYKGQLDSLERKWWGEPSC
jgi:ABC-type amino acid transport substrate-binding protein